MVQNIVQNGYIIKGIENRSVSNDSELSRALQFLTAMDICSNCLPDSAESNLKLGKFIFNINYKERIISVS